jgi:hypothetical protein
MARDLPIDSIDEIEFDDIANLVSEVEEGIKLEFKRDLSTSDGQPDRWMRDQSAIGPVARDDIAKEVVAFANAYGGVIVVGVDETEDHPPRAKRPRGHRAAEQPDELASPHSITSSAVASSLAGISNLRVLAVCTLMINSNLVARSIGRSAGFAL